MGRYHVVYCDLPEQWCLYFRRGASLSLRLSHNGHAKYRNGTSVKRSTADLSMSSRWQCRSLGGAAGTSIPTVQVDFDPAGCVLRFRHC